ncbi:hypothetical protein IE81DRAFT_323574 [Ceraceosorus guamensis]|uniref:SnoaL-like domain-containing protein n=1 Tax=Ceraceosorus guamensis TaxID=1522189 RepID=A0A316VY95_9BASI|nr:hypothetical protein IE81DRAFT_323574 [Ceraceosorus guamensis]PWN42412.1 hypothetical protein IE81DRAFT_323574 [Ceraceosorus guamensis]
MRVSCKSRPLLSLSLLSLATPFLVAGAKPTVASIITTCTFGSLPPQKHFSTSSKVNMAEGQQVDGKSEELIKSVQDLFSCKPTPAHFLKWSPDAIFEDPICYAVGARQYKAQWYGMAKAFAGSELRAWHIESVKPDEIRYAQKQWYKIGSFEKIMDSTVVMKLDKDGKIVHFQDRWGHNEIGSNPLTYIFRRLNAVTLPLFVSIPEGGKAHKDL